MDLMIKELVKSNDEYLGFLNIKIFYNNSVIQMRDLIVLKILLDN